MILDFLLAKMGGFHPFLWLKNPNCKDSKIFLKKVVDKCAEI
jgi:hypothetical protein